MGTRKTLTALGIGLALLLPTTAASCDPQPVAEVEDCDAEDYANREDDCGFTDADRKKTKPKAPVKPKKKR